MHPPRRYTERMERASDELELVDVVAILRDSELSPENRRDVYNTLASAMLDGWNPTRDAVELLMKRSPETSPPTSIRRA
jgi:hypothetical protein